MIGIPDYLWRGLELEFDMSLPVYAVPACPRCGQGFRTVSRGVDVVHRYIGTDLDTLALTCANGHVFAAEQERVKPSGESPHLVFAVGRELCEPKPKPDRGQTYA